MGFSPASAIAGLVGPAHFFYAPSTVARPAKLDDVIGLSTPYAPKTGWLGGGQTTDTTDYSREFDGEELETQQGGIVMRKLTQANRSVTVPLANVTPELTRIAEAAPPLETIAVGAAASGTPAQTGVHLGLPVSLPRYRVAVIAEQPAELTSSREAATRGPLVGILGYSATIAMDDSDTEIGSDEFASREFTFDFYADLSVTDSEKQHGKVVFESGLVIP